MWHLASAILAASLACVAAAPFDAPAKLGKRNWVVNNTGNLDITFSDQTVKLGTAPISVIMGNLSSVCSTQGVCETTPISISGYQLVNGGQGGSVNDETITITPSGAYPTWIHNGLLEALNAAVLKVANCSNVTNDPSCPDPEGGCDDPPFTVNECVVPAYWGIDYQPPGSGSGAPPFIGASLAVTYDNDDGFCSTFFDIASAVAGAVDGTAGGIFSLASLVCGASG